jgi:hypothetical protein
MPREAKRQNNFTNALKSRKASVRVASGADAFVGVGETVWRRQDTTTQGRRELHWNKDCETQSAPTGMATLPMKLAIGLWIETRAVHYI